MELSKLCGKKMIESSMENCRSIDHIFGAQSWWVLTKKRIDKMKITAGTVACEAKRG